MDSATMAKPGRKLVLPPPPAPRQKQQQQPPAAAPAAAKKPPQQAHVQTQGQSWTAVRSQGSRAVGGSAGAARPAGGYSKAGSFSASSGGYTHIPNRPVWLQVRRQPAVVFFASVKALPSGPVGSTTLLPVALLPTHPCAAVPVAAHRCALTWREMETASAIAANSATAGCAPAELLQLHRQSGGLA
jgi:hypothetical protein